MMCSESTYRPKFAAQEAHNPYGSYGDFWPVVGPAFVYTIRSDEWEGLEKSSFDA